MLQRNMIDHVKQVLQQTPSLFSSSVCELNARDAIKAAVQWAIVQKDLCAKH